MLPRGFGSLYSTTVRCLGKRPFRLCPSFPAKNTVSIDGCGSKRQKNMLGMETGVSGLSGGALMVDRVPFDGAAKDLVSSVAGTIRGKGVGTEGISSIASTGIRVLIRLTPNASSSGAVSTLCTFDSYRVGVSPGYYIVRSGGPGFLAIDSILERDISHAVKLLQHRLVVQGNRLRRRLFFSSLRHVFVRRHVCGRHGFRRDGDRSRMITFVCSGLRPFGSRVFATGVSNGKGIRCSFRQSVAHSSVLGLLRVGVRQVLGCGGSGTSSLLLGVGTRLTRVRGSLTRVASIAVG